MFFHPQEVHYYTFLFLLRPSAQKNPTSLSKIFGKGEKKVHSSTSLSPVSFASFRMLKAGDCSRPTAILCALCRVSPLLVLERGKDGSFWYRIDHTTMSNNRKSFFKH